MASAMPLLLACMRGDVCVKHSHLHCTLWFLFVHFVSHYYFGSHKMKGTTRALFTVATRHQMCYEIIGGHNRADHVHSQAYHVHNRNDHIHNSFDHIYNKGNHMLA